MPVTGASSPGEYNGRDFPDEDEGGGTPRLMLNVSAMLPQASRCLLDEGYLPTCGG